MFRAKAIRIVQALGALLMTGVILGALGTSAAFAASCESRIFDSGGFEYDFETASTNPGANPPTLADVYGDLRDGASNGPAGMPAGPLITDDAWDEWGDVYVFQLGADLQHPTVADKYDGPPDACSLALGGQEMAFPV